MSCTGESFSLREKVLPGVSFWKMPSRNFKNIHDMMYVCSRYFCATVLILRRQYFDNVSDTTAYCIVLYSPLLECAVLCCPVLYITVLYCTVQRISRTYMPMLCRWSPLCRAAFRKHVQIIFCKCLSLDLEILSRERESTERLYRESLENTYGT